MCLEADPRAWTSTFGGWVAYRHGPLLLGPLPLYCTYPIEGSYKLNEPRSVWDTGGLGTRLRGHGWVVTRGLNLGDGHTSRGGCWYGLAALWRLPWGLRWRDAAGPQGGREVESAAGVPSYFSLDLVHTVVYREGSTIY